MAPPEVAGEDIAIRRRRLRYRAWHRGTREMDLILGPFADAHFYAFDSEELGRFEVLFDEADPDLLKWLIGQEPPPNRIDRSMLNQLISFREATSRS